MDDAHDEDDNNSAEVMASQKENTPKKETNEEKIKVPTLDKEELSKMMESLQSTDPALRKEAITKFRKILCIERNPPIEKVIASGAIPIFVQLLNDKDWTLRFEATWALTNVAAKNSSAVLDAVPALIESLNSEHVEICEQALLALGNIAGDSVDNRNLLLEMEILSPILKLFSHEFKTTLYRNVTWALASLFRKKPRVSIHLVQPFVPYLAKLLDTPDKEVLADACWALSYISDTGEIGIHTVLETGVARRFVELLEYPDDKVQTAALRNIGNIATGDELQTQLLINLGGLEKLANLLRKTTKKTTTKEIIWTISNITAGSRHQIQKVIDAGLIEVIMSLAKSADNDIRKECLWALGNGTNGGSPAQVAYLVQVGCAEFLCDILSTNDERMLSTALEGIENILKIGAQQEKEKNTYIEPIYTNGIDKIKALLEHPSAEIQYQAGQVIAYFGTDNHA
eukprot:Phypoly_transcript_09146.p1 GENE.Phypoly_transcript_09146~~Phypoly_transcript_09146.p1  ORF type:complete len:465 (+),score=94.08 Phypoly_transcript_09146:26-1396(+)